MTIKIYIPDELSQSYENAFTNNQELFDEKKQTKREFADGMVLNYVKKVTQDYIVNIETVEQVEALKTEIKETVTPNIDKIRIEK